MKLNIGITGIGGNIGLGILNSLKMSKYKNARIIGMDNNSFSVGLYKADKSYIIPKADSPKYFYEIVKICKKEKINALFISTEKELVFLSKNREDFFKKTKTELMIVNPKIIEICLDKWKTCLFLKEKNIPYPKSVLATNNQKEISDFIKKIGFPLVIKPRESRGARDVYIIKSLEELDFYKNKINQPILQKYLLPCEEEYTCGVFGVFGKTFIIIFKRELIDGITNKAIVCKDKEIEELCKKISKALDLNGSINIQLRKTKEGPVPFEINPRYSSTVSIRSHLGFNDVEWAIDAFLLGKKNIKYIAPKKGRLVLRYYENFYPKKSVKPSVKFSNI